MFLAYKIVISLLAMAHIVGFVTGVFFPAVILDDFGLEPNESLLPLAVHFGYLLLIFSAFLGVAVFWTFKGKIEGIQLGLVAGLGITLAFVLELTMVQELDYELMIMGVTTTVSAYLALKSRSALPK